MAFSADIQVKAFTDADLGKKMLEAMGNTLKFT